MFNYLLIHSIRVCVFIFFSNLFQIQKPIVSNRQSQKSKSVKMPAGIKNKNVVNFGVKYFYGTPMTIYNVVAAMRYAFDKYTSIPMDWRAERWQLKVIQNAYQLPMDNGKKTRTNVSLGTATNLIEFFTGCSPRFLRPWIFCPVIPIIHTLYSK